MTTLREIGEVAVIDRLAKYLPRGEGVIVGQGDDCAVVRSPDNTAQDWLLTCDPVIEGVHFKPGTPPAGIGRKAIGRVLSDIAAMGGEPAWALVDVVASHDTPVATLETAYDGASDMAGRYGLAIVGGDVSEGGVLELHVFAVGFVPAGQAALRSGARPSDFLFVTGMLGGSLHGRHLSFEPRIREGVWLREWVTSLIDISDGLASDLRHLITASGVGAQLALDDIPIADDAAKFTDSMAPVQHALYDGEDFELLFTVPADRQEAFRAGWQATFQLPCTCIGTITEGPCEIECIDESGNITVVERRGYEHFVAASGGGRST